MWITQKADKLLNAAIVFVLVRAGIYKATFCQADTHTHTLSVFATNVCAAELVTY